MGVTTAFSVWRNPFSIRIPAFAVKSLPLKASVPLPDTDSSDVPVAPGNMAAMVPSNSPASCSRMARRRAARRPETVNLPSASGPASSKALIVPEYATAAPRMRAVISRQSRRREAMASSPVTSVSVSGFFSGSASNHSLGPSIRAASSLAPKSSRSTVPEAVICGGFGMRIPSSRVSAAGASDRVNAMRSALHKLAAHQIQRFGPEPVPGHPPARGQRACRKRNSSSLQLAHCMRRREFPTIRSNGVRPGVAESA